MRGGLIWRCSFSSWSRSAYFASKNFGIRRLRLTRRSRKGVQRRVRQDRRGARSSPNRANARHSERPEPTGKSWPRPMVRRARPTRGGLGDHDQSVDRSRAARRRRERAGSEGIRPRRTAHRGHLQGRRRAADAADRGTRRRQAATSTPSSRQAEGVPDPVVHRVDLQRKTFDLRDKSALKIDAQKSIRSKSFRLDRHDQVRQGERNVAARRTGRAAD